MYTCTGREGAREGGVLYRLIYSIYVHLCNELVPDIGVIEPSPQFKGHAATAATSPHDSSLHWVGGGEQERVPGLMCERGVGYTQCHVCAEWLQGHLGT